jgi:2-polyprenyl-3-methyl-5-hydroxy-6-metoxy-1,4-benzoquinol methylase
LLRDHKSVDFDLFLSEIRNFLNTHNSNLLDLFDVFADEAKFARHVLDDSLSNLSPGQKILEVGGGLMLLSIQLQREGYAVTALEPIGEGFSVFTELQNLILNYAQKLNCVPMILSIAVEDMKHSHAFDFAFSINVMEHVNDVERALSNILISLKPNASYRFICPNYTFPYEPHFNIPILFSKNITQKIFKEKIFKSTRVIDQMGVWKSLNWITVSSVKNSISRLSNATLIFNNNILSIIFLRMLTDPQFSKRRSNFIFIIIKYFILFKLHHLLKFFPITISPLMDCSIKKRY